MYTLSSFGKVKDEFAKMECEALLDCQLSMIYEHGEFSFKYAIIIGE